MYSENVIFETSEVIFFKLSFELTICKTDLLKRLTFAQILYYGID